MAASGVAGEVRSVAAARRVAGDMLRRLLLHLVTTRWHLRRAFPEIALNHVEAAIKASELTHAGELRVVLEGALTLAEVMVKVTPRARAIAVFRDLHGWDTEANNGVVIYVLFAERAIEIIADRGFNGRVSDDEWRAACALAESEFRVGRFETGLVKLITAAGTLIARHFPLRAGDVNELADRPVLL